MRGVLPPEVIAISTSPSTDPFWKAAGEHRLVIPQCTTCGTFRLPPSPFCFHCRAQDVDWIEHDGAGQIYSFTVIRHAVIPAVAEALPLVAAVVDLPGTGGGPPGRPAPPRHPPPVAPRPPGGPAPLRG